MHIHTGTHSLLFPLSLSQFGGLGFFYPILVLHFPLSLSQFGPSHFNSIPVIPTSSQRWCTVILNSTSTSTSTNSTIRNNNSNNNSNSSKAETFTEAHRHRRRRWWGSLPLLPVHSIQSTTTPPALLRRTTVMGFSFFLCSPFAFITKEISNNPNLWFFFFWRMVLNWGKCTKFQVMGNL